MDLCLECNECIKNCPVSAIHADDFPGWLDKKACRDFYVYGDHPFISSVKYGINSFLNNKYSEEELKKIKNGVDYKKFFGFEDEETMINKDNKTYFLDIKYCRECMNQLPCRKTKFSYDKNYCEVINMIN